MTLITLATYLFFNLGKYGKRVLIIGLLSIYLFPYTDIYLIIVPFGLFVYLSFKLGHELHREMNQTSLFTVIFTVPIAMYLHILGTDKLILNERIK